MIVKLTGGEFVDLYDATGVAVGTQLIVTNVTTSDVRLFATETTPDPSTDNSFPCIFGGSSVINNPGDSGAWVISPSNGAVLVTSLDGSGFKPLDVSILTNLVTSLDGNGRIKVDSQQSSFEQNTQFRFFEDVSDQTEYGGDDLSVPAANVLVYEFNAVNPVNIQTRIINQWSGGRKYLVFPTTGATITGGTWEDVSDQLYIINGNKNPYIDALPTTEVTVRRRVATSFVTSEKARTGTAAVTESQGNRQSSEYSPDSSRSGVAGNQGFYLVFFDLDGANPSEFLFTVAYEERF